MNQIILVLISYNYKINLVDWEQVTAHERAENVIIGKEWKNK